MIRISLAAVAVAVAYCPLAATAAARHRHASHAHRASPAEIQHSAALDAMIRRYAKMHGVPESLVHRIVIRESRYNPSLRNHSYYGLMQISYATARSMGYKGTPAGLLDPDVNLTYAVPYLANAYMLSGHDEGRAVSLYAGGYYWVAKRKKMLAVLRTAASSPIVAQPDALAFAPAEPPPSNPISQLFHVLARGSAPDPAAAPPPPPSAPQPALEPPAQQSATAPK